MRDANLPTVVVVGALPPPIHGQAAVNAAVAERLKSLPVSLAVVNTSPGSTEKSISYHLKRVSGVLRAVKELATRRVARTKTLYMPFQAGNGIVYNFFLALISHLTGFRIVLHHHSSAHTSHRQIFFALLARLCGRRTIHVALSAAMAHDLEEHYGLSGQTVVGSNACHIKVPTTASTAKSPDVLTVGLLANLNAEKGLALAIDAVIIARSQGAAVKLVLAGPLQGPDAVRIAVHASGSLGEALELWGPVSGSRKEDFFQCIDIFLFPTMYRYEAQPLVIYEAMSCGIPVISTNVGYIPEMLANVGKIVSLGPSLADRLAAELLNFHASAPLLVSASADSKREFDRIAKISHQEFGWLCEMLVGSQEDSVSGSGT
ncbi:glycosyltransferase family 4 protein [Bradyrhizobium sp. 38]|uniref:glycosyltransferase family 4 protein n=1 Tax=unclassified Bradyrhizobium TaxID=2631580 RepID=UPI001FF85EF7|nr:MULTISPECIES: glycosyltransferase family 4 protein [unclassified Bradyrhizobium]MCK1341631.1 glycosyltransferase family 4 protein [Bradyrhizobium sp. 38]MCK1778838.1 glycosyltransferase family 4 protein [Bradyrhizobium sp. 132]